MDTPTFLLGCSPTTSSQGRSSGIASILPNCAAPIQVKPGSSTLSVLAGYSSIFFLTADGSVLVVGNNSHGSLGIPGAVLVPRPIQVRLPKVDALAVGPYHTVALCADGSVWGWGSNLYKQLSTEHLKNYWKDVAEALGGKSLDAVYTFDTKSRDHLPMPARLSKLEAMDPIKVYCGMFYTVIQAGDGALYFQGACFSSKDGSTTCDKPIKLMEPYSRKVLDRPGMDEPDLIDGNVKCVFREGETIESVSCANRCFSIITTQRNIVFGYCPTLKGWKPFPGWYESPLDAGEIHVLNGAHVVRRFSTVRVFAEESEAVIDNVKQIYALGDILVVRCMNNSISYYGHISNVERAGDVSMVSFSRPDVVVDRVSGGKFFVLFEVTKGDSAVGLDNLADLQDELLADINALDAQTPMGLEMSAFRRFGGSVPEGSQMLDLELSKLNLDLDLEITTVERSEYRQMSVGEERQKMGSNTREQAAREISTSSTTLPPLNPSQQQPAKSPTQSRFRNMALDSESSGDTSEDSIELSQDMKPGSDTEPVSEPVTMVGLAEQKGTTEMITVEEDVGQGATGKQSSDFLDSESEVELSNEKISSHTTVNTGDTRSYNEPKQRIDQPDDVDMVTEAAEVVRTLEPEVSEDIVQPDELRTGVAPKQEEGQTPRQGDYSRFIGAIETPSSSSDTDNAPEIDHNIPPTQVEQAHETVVVPTEDDVDDWLNNDNEGKGDKGNEVDIEVAPLPPTEIIVPPEKEIITNIDELWDAEEGQELEIAAAEMAELEEKNRAAAEQVMEKDGTPAVPMPEISDVTTTTAMVEGVTNVTDQIREEEPAQDNRADQELKEEVRMEKAEESGENVLEADTAFAESNVQVPNVLAEPVSPTENLVEPVTSVPPQQAPQDQLVSTSTEPAVVAVTETEEKEESWGSFFDEDTLSDDFGLGPTTSPPPQQQQETVTATQTQTTQAAAPVTPVSKAPTSTPSRQKPTTTTTQPKITKEPRVAAAVTVTETPAPCPTQQVQHCVTDEQVNDILKGLELSKMDVTVDERLARPDPSQLTGLLNITATISLDQHISEINQLITRMVKYRQDVSEQFMSLKKQYLKRLSDVRKQKAELVKRRDEARERQAVAAKAKNEELARFKKAVPSVIYPLAHEAINKTMVDLYIHKFRLDANASRLDQVIGAERAKLEKIIVDFTAKRDKLDAVCKAKEVQKEREIKKRYFEEIRRLNEEHQLLNSVNNSVISVSVADGEDIEVQKEVEELMGIDEKLRQRIERLDIGILSSSSDISAKSYVSRLTKETLRQLDDISHLARSKLRGIDRSSRNSLSSFHGLAPATAYYYSLVLDLVELRGRLNEQYTSLVRFVFEKQDAFLHHLQVMQLAEQRKQSLERRAKELMTELETGEGAERGVN